MYCKISEYPFPPRPSESTDRVLTPPTPFTPAPGKDPFIPVAPVGPVFPLFLCVASTHEYFLLTLQ